VLAIKVILKAGIKLSIWFIYLYYRTMEKMSACFGCFTL